MREVIKYVADDGTEFTDKTKCLAYEKNIKTIVDKINENKNDSAKALIAFMTCVQDLMGVDIVDHKEYVRLFAEHRPCSYYCSLFKVITDYASEYPRLVNIYYELMINYNRIYGKKKII